MLAHALNSQLGIVSYQVVQEFCNFACKAKRPPLPQDRILPYVNLVLQPMNQVGPSPALMESALKLRGEHGFSFYESLIIASATHPGRLCNRRLHHGATGRVHLAALHEREPDCEVELKGCDDERPDPSDPGSSGSCLVKMLWRSLYSACGRPWALT